jgi:hypothetical protein
VVGAFVDGTFADYDKEALGLTRETLPRRSGQSAPMTPAFSMSYI